MKQTNTTRRSILVSAVVAVGLLVAAPAASQAQSEPFSASFMGVQKHNDPPCAGGASFCGSGSVAGYGAATYSGYPIALGPLGGSCRSITAIAFIDLEDGSGSLTALVNGTVCYPGRSNSAPGSSLSFGNPFRLDASYELSAGEGVFAGVTGTGTATLQGAGAQSRLEVSGTVGS